MRRSRWLPTYSGSTLLSDDHVPLLFTITHSLARLDKPSPQMVSRTLEYHVGPVALSPADTADFRASVLQRRDIDPQLAPARWLKCLRRAIYDWVKAAGRSVPSISGTTASDRARPKGKVPVGAISGAQYAPLHGAIHRGGPRHGNSVVVGHTLKRSLVALGEA